MEQQLLKKLLDHNFFVENQARVHRAYFPAELAALYDTMVKAHEKYDTDLTPEWVLALHREYNPSITAAARRNIANLLDDITHVDSPPDDMAADILTSLYRKEAARSVANVAIDVINGKVDDLSVLKSSLDEINSDSGGSEEFVEVKFNLQEFLDGKSDDKLFPFRLSVLREQIIGLGRGNFCIIFARPDVGKTAYGVYECAGFLQQGLRCVYFANEEPAHLPFLRLVSSIYECSEETLARNTDKIGGDFARDYGENFSMYDCVGYDITTIKRYVDKHKPDVVFIDQLDKLTVQGNYNRDDERLGKLYTAAREIAKTGDCLVMALSQASAEAEGKQFLHYSMLAGARTSKGAEADMAIGIGCPHSIAFEDDFRRTFTVSKNKINGWHGHITTLLDQHTVTFNA